MTCLYHYTPAIWPSVFTVLLLSALAVYAWQKRGVPGALVFAIGCLLYAPWAAGSVMELAAVDVECKIFWFQFQGAWQLPGVTAATCFVLEYAWPGRWLTRRNLALLSIPPLLVLGLILTNDLHHLIWRGFAYDGTVIPLRGLVNWMLLLYAYGLGIVNLVVFAWLFVRSPQHRWPVVIMLTGCIVGRMLYLLEATQALQPDLPIDVPPVAFEYLMYAVALFGFRLFDPIPLARQTVIAQMHEGVLVLDPQGRVASLNPAAERILHLPARRARGQPVRELLPAYPDEHLTDTQETEIELSLPQEHSRQDTPGTTPGRCGTVRDDVGAAQVRRYTLEISLLRDWRGLAVGRLLLLHDVTAQKRAQAQLVEQQRALAMLHERESLARELHDDLGQVLGYASFQVETAAKLARDGQGDAAATQLDHLGSVIRDAHADVREYILNLHSTPSLQQPFFVVLRKHLQGFKNNYDIQTHLTIDPGLGEEPFGPDAQLQVLRIVQEALSNARKHGQARHVQVTFAAQDGWVCMTIRDDGRGFAPDNWVTAGGSHFGLQFMRERAGQLGGSLQVQSAPGAGTQVILQVPGNLTQRRQDPKG